MKKIILVQEHPIRNGSAITHLNLTISRHLKKRGWEVVIINSENIQKFSQNKASTKINATPRGIKKIIRVKNKTVILNVGFHYKSLTTTVLEESIKSNSPYMIWCHVNLDNCYRKKDPQFQTAIEEHRYFLNHQLCKGVLCCSKNVARSLNNLVRDKEKIAVVYPIINFTTKTSKDRPGYRLRGDLLFAGRLSQEKNVELLLKAGQKLIRHHPLLKLNIVGEGPEEERLKNLSKDLGMNQNIRFTKFLPQLELRRWIKGHKIVCLTSLTESFGMVAMEALMLGVPIIGPNLEGPKEITQNGQYGLLFKVGDINDFVRKIHWALNNYQILKEKTNNAKKILADKYHPHRQLFSLEKIILQKTHFSEIYLPQTISGYSSFSHFY